MTLVKSQLIDNLSERSGMTLPLAEVTIDLFFSEISKKLSEGGRVEIRGFGAFSVKEYKPYRGRNPKTGKMVLVQPKRLPSWRTGTQLRQRVDSGFS